MSASVSLAGWLLRPWHIAAVTFALLAVLLPMGRAEAAIGAVVTVNNTTAGAQTNLSIALTLDTDLAIGNTITVTFPAGWTVPDGDLTAGGTGHAAWAGLVDVAPTIPAR